MEVSIRLESQSRLSAQAAHFSAFRICLALLFAISLFGTQQQAHASDGVEATIPFAVVDGRILIPVRLNGRGPYRMIFDSGASAVLSPEIVQTLRLGTSDTHAESGTGASSVKVSQTQVARLTLGKASFSGLAFDVTSMRDMPPVFGNVKIDGILGRPVFDRFVVEVDYDRQLLFLIDPHRFQPVPSDTSLPFVRIRDVPLVEAALDGRSGRFGVDLGARSSLILTNSFAEQSGLIQMFDTAPEMITGWGLGGPIRAKLARAKQFELQGVTIHSPVVRLSVQKAGLLAKSDSAGLIGADILRQFIITFDPSRKVVYLRRSKQFGKPLSFDQSGMWLIQSGNAFEVLDVVPGKAASHAKIQAGDRVLSIDGRPTKSLKIAAVRERWASAPMGTKIHLRLQRGRGTSNVVVTLAPVV